MKRAQGNALWQELIEADKVWKQQRLSVEETRDILLKHTATIRDQQLARQLYDLEIGEAIRMKAEDWKYKRIDVYKFNQFFQNRGFPNRYGLRQINEGKEYVIIRKS